jgi:hypothetical protein
LSQVLQCLTPGQQAAQGQLPRYQPAEHQEQRLAGLPALQQKPALAVHMPVQLVPPLQRQQGPLALTVHQSAQDLQALSCAGLP